MGTDTLVVEQINVRDPLAGTWRIEGAPEGRLTRAEDLTSVSTSGVAWGRLGAEQIFPRRDLQGTIDRTQANQARIDVRQRGLGRWDEWGFNGIHSLDGSGVSQDLEPLPSLQQTNWNGAGGTTSQWWNPTTWKAPKLPQIQMPDISLPKIRPPSLPRIPKPSLPKWNLWPFSSKTQGEELPVSQ